MKRWKIHLVKRGKSFKVWMREREVTWPATAEMRRTAAVSVLMLRPGWWLTCPSPELLTAHTGSHKQQQGKSGHSDRLRLPLVQIQRSKLVINPCHDCHSGKKIILHIWSSSKLDLVTSLFIVVRIQYMLRNISSLVFPREMLTIRLDFVNTFASSCPRGVYKCQGLDATWYSWTISTYTGGCKTF